MINKCQQKKKTNNNNKTKTKGGAPLLGLAKSIYLTIRLWARDFYRVIVDEAESIHPSGQLGNKKPILQESYEYIVLNVFKIWIWIQLLLLKQKIADVGSKK